MNDTRKLQYRLVECPHCHKPIELLKNSDIEERHGITERERSRSGQWPEPWIVLGNVSLWLASEVDEAAARLKASKRRRRIEPAIEAIENIKPEDLEGQDLESLERLRTLVDNAMKPAIAGRRRASKG